MSKPDQIFSDRVTEMIKDLDQRGITKDEWVYVIDDFAARMGTWNHSIPTIVDWAWNGTRDERDVDRITASIIHALFHADYSREEFVRVLEDLVVVLEVYDCDWDEAAAKAWDNWIKTN